MTSSRSFNSFSAALICPICARIRGDSDNRDSRGGDGGGGDAGGNNDGHDGDSSGGDDDVGGDDGDIIGNDGGVGGAQTASTHPYLHPCDADPRDSLRRTRPVRNER